MSVPELYIIPTLMSGKEASGPGFTLRSFVHFASLEQPRSYCSQIGSGSLRINPLPPVQFNVTKVETNEMLDIL